MLALETLARPDAAEPEMLARLQPVYERMRRVVPPMEWPFFARISTRSSA